MMQMLNQFKANPAQYLLQSKLNIPKTMLNDPQAMVNHLLQTGQITQQQINNAYQMMGQFKR